MLSLEADLKEDLTRETTNHGKADPSQEADQSQDPSLTRITKGVLRVVKMGTGNGNVQTGLRKSKMILQTLQ